jgi:hypothetical protein
MLTQNVTGSVALLDLGQTASSHIGHRPRQVGHISAWDGTCGFALTWRVA